MELTIAETAGFCMGVDMALHKLDNALSSLPQNACIYTLGPIIHNPQVLARYKSQGVLQTDGSLQLKAGDVVVIRAHGIPKNIQQGLEAQKISIVDATCPKVKKAQILIQRQAAQNKHLLLFGERDHPEVRGLVSYAPEHTIFESLEELQDMVIDPAQTYFLAAQTTQDRDIFNAIEEYLTVRVDADMTILDTICMATKDRQEEVRELSRKVEGLVVVGGKNSGNTRRLAQIAQEAGIYAVHVETADELPLAELARFKHIGLTAGASTPSWIIQDVAQVLQKVESETSCEIERE
jgi:4-hydroxy-3-methylbut-2-enyl diphosphate reductase